MNHEPEIIMGNRDESKGYVWHVRVEGEDRVLVIENFEG